MLRQCGSPRDRVLFQILKNKSPTASKICEKLNYNVKNILLLSEDELCELWQHIKLILLESQKILTQASGKRDRYLKDCNLVTKLIRTITALALETILQQKFISKALLQNIMLLHSIVLPNIKVDQAKNEISHLMENWWKLDMTWKEKVITNALKYLIQNCKSSLQLVKRLYEIRSAIVLLKCAEDVKILLKLVREKTVMSFKEGRMLILYLFTLGEQYILGIHNNVRVVLQDIEHTYIAGYADLYVTAWLNATEKLKQFMVENCLQNIVFHCFRSYRDSKGRGKLGKNLLSFLAAMHENENQAAKLMIHNQCKSLLWEHLKAPGSFIRCNAVEILFITSSVQYTCGSKDRNKNYLKKYYKAITELLKDTNFEVCNVTINSLFRMLEKYWSCISKNVIREWLNILLHYTRNASNPEIRANIFIGLRRILVKERSHRMLKDFLPNFANSIYDEEKIVLEALIKLLWHAQNELEMPFWDIVPLTYILDRLETTQDPFLLQELIKLIWLRISSNGTEYDKMKDEIIYIGTNNVNAIRRFCFHSKSVINWDTSIKVIETLLSMIKEEIACLPVTKALDKNCNKRAKFSNEDNRCANDYLNNREEDFDSYNDIQIYIDVIAMLLVANVNSAKGEKFYKEKMNILQMIARTLPELFTYFQATPINESVIFLFSLMPPQNFFNEIEIIEMLVQQLCDPNVPDDTLLTIIYVLMKWNKGDTILYALTNLVTESLNMITQHNQDITNSTDVYRVNEKGLELSLRILKHLLHVEDQSVLMNKYHKDLLKFWEHLHRIRHFIEENLNNEYRINDLVSKDIIIQLFKQYVSMISILHKKDMFDAAEHFSEILSWIKSTMVPHMSRIDVNVIENHQICINIIKSTFDMSNLLLKDYNCTAKLCCDVVLLYCSCLSLASGVVFLSNAFDGIISLLEFSKMAYENEERNLLDIVMPNFICVTMVALTTCGNDVLSKYTNNLKVLNELTQKYFIIIKDRNLYYSYITIMFNTAISSISAEMTRVLQCSCVTKESLLRNSFKKFPYLARKILRIILSVKRYQKLCIQVLTKTITSYTKIDMLSALIVIYEMIKTTDKTIINRLKNIVLASKVHNQKQSYDTSFDRSINGAIDIVTDAILKQ
ncbi:unnamed protein product [Xylocopa violacea]|uniref:Condensin-2 complex subunit G2 n=1 Tax=Xylocopa violacea TaxID=135666 RepID=A0ABP1NIB5_XYLVO